MKRVFFDFETYWSGDYTLSDIVTIDYILDPRWETIGCGIAIDSDPPFWLPRDKAEDFFNSINEPYMAISHNSLFDSSILAYRYGIHPTLNIDTMGMARAILMSQLPRAKVSLEFLAKFMEIGVKPKTVLKTKGLSRKEIESNRALYREFSQYCLNDVELCRQIYFKLFPKFPASEHVIMDMIIKTTTHLQLGLNIEHLQEHLALVKAEKIKSLEFISKWFTAEDLRSNERFAQALKYFGVEPPTKISPVTHKTTWAFAKNDFAFVELLSHPNPYVQALMAARFEHKSTLEETRTEKFISIANSTLN